MGITLPAESVFSVLFSFLFFFFCFSPYLQSSSPFSSLSLLIVVTQTLGHIAEGSFFPSPPYGSRLSCFISIRLEPLLPSWNTVDNRCKGPLLMFKVMNATVCLADADTRADVPGVHFCQVLKPKVPARRAVFHEITQEALVKAFEVGGN